MILRDPRCNLVQFVIGQGQVIAGWDKGFATMKRGEKAVLTCSPENAYGPGGSPPAIPANATLKFDVSARMSYRCRAHLFVSGGANRLLRQATRKVGDDLATTG